MIIKDYLTQRKIATVFCMIVLIVGIVAYFAEPRDMGGEDNIPDKENPQVPVQSQESNLANLTQKITDKGVLT